MVIVLLATSGLTRQTLAAQQQFEVVSVKSCKETDLPGGGHGRNGGAGRISTSPGRLHVECVTLDSLIRDAFLQYSDGEPWPIGKTGVRQPPISTRLLDQE